MADKKKKKPEEEITESQEAEGPEEAESPEEPAPSSPEPESAVRPPEEAGGEEEELTEEELRKLIEEQLERVTVGQMVQQMMVTLASIGYQKMGLPEEVNLKYRDLEQARLAVDSLDALLRASSGKMPDDQLEPFRGTLANLKLNYVSISAKLKGESQEGSQESKPEKEKAEEAGEEA